MIWDQGVIYFALAVVANLVPAVVLMIDLNPVMNIIFSIPAIAVTATVSTRCFVKLSEYAEQNDDNFSGMTYVDTTLHSRIVLPLCSSSLHGAKPWAKVKRPAGPTTSLGPGSVYQHAQHAQPAQFTRQVRTGTSKAGDIVVGLMSPTKTSHRSASSPSSITPYPFHIDESDKPRSSKDLKDFV